MADPLVDFTKACAQLKTSNPSGWGLLVAAFHQFHAANYQSLLRAPGDRLGFAQGRLYTIDEICNVFAECVERSQAYEQKIKGPQ